MSCRGMYLQDEDAGLEQEVGSEMETLSANGSCRASNHLAVLIGWIVVVLITCGLIPTPELKRRGSSSLTSTASGPHGVDSGERGGPRPRSCSFARRVREASLCLSSDSDDPLGSPLYSPTRRVRFPEGPEEQLIWPGRPRGASPGVDAGVLRTNWFARLGI
eukprot:g1213.t1